MIFRLKKKELTGRAENNKILLKPNMSTAFKCYIQMLGAVFVNSSVF